MFAITLYLLTAAAVTAADVRSEIDDVVKHLPMDEIAQLLQKYLSTASSFRGDFRDLQPRSYDEIRNVFGANKDVQEIREYFKRRSVDQSVVYLLQLTWDYLNKHSQDGFNADSLSSRGPTVSGFFLADFIEAINASGFLDFVLKKQETSPELAKLIAALNDREFKGLLYQAVKSFS